MKNYLKTITLFLIISFLSSCRASDCGCPMSLNDNEDTLKIQNILADNKIEVDG